MPRCRYGIWGSMTGRGADKARRPVCVGGGADGGRRRWEVGGRRWEVGEWRWEVGGWRWEVGEWRANRRLSAAYLGATARSKANKRPADVYLPCSGRDRADPQHLGGPRPLIRDLSDDSTHLSGWERLIFASARPRPSSAAQSRGGKERQGGADGGRRRWEVGGWRWEVGEWRANRRLSAAYLGATARSKANKRPADVYLPPMCAQWRDFGQIGIQMPLIRRRS